MNATACVFGEHAVVLGGAVDSGGVVAGVLMPGPGGTMRERADRAVDPAAEADRMAAAQSLGVLLADQEEADVVPAAALCPPSAEAERHAAAVLELGVWRGRVRRCEPGPRLAALLAQRPDALAPAGGRGLVVHDETQLSDGRAVRTVTAGGEGGSRGAAGGRGSAPACSEQWPDVVLSTIQARARLISHLQAEQYADVAGLSACYPGIHQFLATELGLALSLTDAQAATMLHTAETLRDRLPATGQALAAGAIDDAKAQAMVRATAGTSDEVARAVEASVLPEAGGMTAATVRRRAGRAVIAADPGQAAERHRRARGARYLSRRMDEDGMATMNIYAPAQDVATVWNALTACADAARFPGDERTLGARRVDALVDVCRDIVRGGGWEGLRLPDSGRRGRPQVRVTVPYTVLAGQRAVCELDGYGAICTEQALGLVGTGDLYRLVCDPVSGQLLDYGLTRYRPPHLAEFVRARDGQCPLPTCDQPADRGQLDHIVPARPDPMTGRPTQGPTSAANLAAPCRHHHLAKDAGRGFGLHRARDGTYTWTTPLGRSYSWRPEPQWVADAVATVDHDVAPRPPEPQSLGERSVRERPAGEPPPGERSVRERPAGEPPPGEPPPGEPPPGAGIPAPPEYPPPF